MNKPHLGKIPSLGVAQRLLHDNETIKHYNLARINITKMTFFFFHFKHAKKEKKKVVISQFCLL